MGTKSLNKVANLNTSLKNAAIPTNNADGDMEEHAQQGDKMDVTALMDLLDKNRGSDSRSTDNDGDSNKKSKKVTPINKVTDSLDNIGQHNTNNNEPLFVTRPLHYMAISAIVAVTLFAFIAMLYIVDNKAEDWFVSASAKKELSESKLDNIAPSSGSQAMQKRLEGDKKLAEDSAKKSNKAGSTLKNKPKIITVDGNELLRLLSKTPIQ